MFMNEENAVIEDLINVSYGVVVIFLIVIVGAMILSQVTTIANLTGNAYATVVNNVAGQYGSIVLMIGLAIVIVVALNAILGGFIRGLLGGQRGI